MTPWTFSLYLSVPHKKKAMRLRCLLWASLFACISAKQNHLGKATRRRPCLIENDCSKAKGNTRENMTPHDVDTEANALILKCGSHVDLVDESRAESGEEYRRVK